MFHTLLHDGGVIILYVVQPTAQCKNTMFIIINMKWLFFQKQSCYYKCKNIFTKMLKDVGIEVPKSIETRSKYTIHADKDRG